MQKALILLFLVLNWSCTSRLFIPGENRDSETNSSEEIIRRTIENNISLDSYSIVKGDILLELENSSKKFLFTGKFEKPDKFLFSLKGLTGIEGARIYLTKDTILINDRINKRLLYGKPETIEKLTGMPFNFINMIFGDLVTQDGTEKIKFERVNRQFVIRQNTNLTFITSVVENRIYKVVSASLLNTKRNEEILIRYSRFLKDNKQIPSRIELEDKNRKVSAKIRIKNIEIPWEGKIEFIPGQGYKREEIK